MSLKEIRPFKAITKKPPRWSVFHNVVGFGESEDYIYQEHP